MTKKCLLAAILFGTCINFGQSAQSDYELLGLKRGASLKEIDRACNNKKKDKQFDQKVEACRLLSTLAWMKKVEAASIAALNESQKKRCDLWEAVATNDTKFVASLLTEGVSANIRFPTPGYGFLTPVLHLAASRGNLDIGRLLIEHNADVDAYTEDTSTALHEAANEGHTAFVELLLNNQASINIRKKGDKTALDIAKAKGHKDIVKLLRKKTHKK